DAGCAGAATELTGEVGRPGADVHAVGVAVEVAIASIGVGDANLRAARVINPAQSAAGIGGVGGADLTSEVVAGIARLQHRVDLRRGIAPAAAVIKHESAGVDDIDVAARGEDRVEGVLPQNQRSAADGGVAGVGIQAGQLPVPGAGLIDGQYAAGAVG